MRGLDFPHEGFVQKALEEHFGRLGFSLDPTGHADIQCRHPSTGEQWLVEAKGLTSAVGLDFRTGLGQLIQRMEDQKTKYALAVPDIPGFVAQCKSVPTWVRSALGIHWLLVAKDGGVRVLPPSDSP